MSTRRESAELMGVSLPDMPSVSMEDNVNLGEKDSIRRRALWALEGKPDVSFSKVEIPELGTPDVEKMMFDFCERCFLAHMLRILTLDFPKPPSPPFPADSPLALGTQC